MCLRPDYGGFSLCPISVSVRFCGLQQAHDEDLMQFAGLTLPCLLKTTVKRLAQAIGALLKTLYA